MKKQYGRGIGGQKFAFGNAGGSIAFVYTDSGQLIDRLDNYDYDTWMALPVKDFYDSARGKTINVTE